MAIAKVTPDPGIAIAWECPGPVAVIEKARMKESCWSILKIWLIGMGLLGPMTLALIHQLAPEMIHRPAIGLAVIAVGFPLYGAILMAIDLRSTTRYEIGASGVTRRSSGGTLTHRWKYLLGYRIVSHDEVAGMKCLELRI